MSKAKIIQTIFILSVLILTSPALAQKKDIELYFFYSPLCSACSQTEILLGNLKTKYPNLQIKKFKISTKNNQKIYFALAEIYQVNSNFVPGIFIEKKGFNGCSSNTISEIEKILIRCSSQECDSPTQKLLANSAEKKIPISKSNLNIIYIIAITLVLGFVLIKIFFRRRRKLSNDSHLQK